MLDIYSSWQNRTLLELAQLAPALTELGTAQLKIFHFNEIVNYWGGREAATESFVVFPSLARKGK